RALDAAAEAMHGLDRLNADRARMGKPIAAVDLALHLGEVLYGNVGAVDRLDFTVIGPAVNEVARIETLCEPLDRKVLVSAALAAAIRDRTRLEPLGAHVLRGVREAKEIFALRPYLRRSSASPAPRRMSRRTLRPLQALQERPEVTVLINCACAKDYSDSWQSLALLLTRREPLKRRCLRRDPFHQDASPRCIP